MCCTIYFDRETEEAIRSLVNEISEAASFQNGVLRPSDSITVVSGRRPGLTAEDMRWGFPSPIDGKLMINARAETALEKKTFSDSVRSRRCVIAASRFYEWDKDKNKVSFFSPENAVIFLAGFFHRFPDGDRFIVLTTAANESILPVHDRMPLSLPRDLVLPWITDDKETEALLKTPQPFFRQYRPYEQLSLFS